MRFDLYNQKFCDILYDVIIKGRILKPGQGYDFDASERSLSCHRVFSCKVGYNIGVHKWKLKYMINDDKSITSPYGGIGICSDNKILKKSNKFGNYAQTNYKLLHWVNNKSFGSCIYYDQGSNCIYQYINGKGKVLFRKKQMNDHTESYVKGDVITIILDCNRWKLKILKNDENILLNEAEIDIKKKYIKYYPVLAFYHHDDTYRVLKQ